MFLSCGAVAAEPNNSAVRYSVSSFSRLFCYCICNSAMFKALKQLHSDALGKGNPWINANNNPESAN